MGLSLPADAEAFLSDGDAITDSSVYALELSKPPDPAAAWDRHYDTRPPWFPEFLNNPRTIYVGATGNLIGRLEDHRDGDVRQASILQVCDIDALIDVRFHENPFDHEFNVGVDLSRKHPDAYVHQR